MVEVRHLGPANPAAHEVGHDVQPAERGLDGGDDCRGRNRVGEVARHREHRVCCRTQLRHRVREAHGIGAVERDPGPVGQGPFRATARPGRRPGDGR